ncbi:MAG TPA: hypothetical protein VJY63_09905 [Marinospirillum sp.]|uniref:hypothetical protein n=1 Tax=Marinospirillum sp. TaxID=2183934 RepID=UPI002B47FFF5|nr:hypothetical protein [Marinospirillum sp.]HKM16211.1 hypothetical protein [Marinospirillum sp.]
MNMDYETLTTLVERFQSIDEEDEANGVKPIGVIRSFSDLPQHIFLSGKKVGENTYASVDYQSDQDDGEEPDEPITEALVSIRIVEDLPEEKSRAEIINAQWRFTAKGIEQTRGELSDLMGFFEFGFML